MKVGVVGLGYVGLPLATVLALAGHTVTGYDYDIPRLETLRAGHWPPDGAEPDLPTLFALAVRSGDLRFTADPAALRECEVALIAVPTPLDEQHRAPYTELLSAIDTVAANLPPGGLVVVESTVGPGTCDHLLKPRLPRHALAHCPERLMPGRALRNLTTLPRVLGADSANTGGLLLALYGSLTSGALTVTDLVTAELVKTAENAYRDVEIAFANELAYLCEGYGGDVWQVRELVNALGDRYVLEPGAGVGGHCLPKDTWLLVQQHGGAELLPAARRVNERAPLRVGWLLITALEQHGMERRARVVLLGETYRPDVADARHSPTTALLSHLDGLVRVVVHDPYTRPGDLYELAAGADALVLMTAHQEYSNLDFARLRTVMRTPLLIDGRGLWRANPPDGFEYVLLGRG